MGTPRDEPRSLRAEIREYYGAILPYLERSLAGRGDLEMWREIVRESDASSVLELGAGTGRVTRVLGEEAERVVGLDLSLEMLRRAREHRGGPGTSLVAADIRSFRLDARFGLVVAANDPFSHLREDADRDRALERVALHMPSDGRFVLDALWLPPEALREACSEEGRLVETRAPRGPEGETLSVRARWRCDPERRLCRVRYSYSTGGSPEARVTFRGRYWTRREVRTRLPTAGLAPVELWGTYGRDPWTPDSPRMVVVAKRA